MKVEGSLTVSTDPQTLWDLLQDPEFLKEVMPGCKKLDRSGEDEFTGVIEARIGAIASQYTTKFSLLDKNPPESYRLKLDGKGKGGFVQADTLVRLEADGATTVIRYQGEVAIGGTIARIGQRLIDAASKMLLNRGFENLKKKIEDKLAS